MEQWHDLFVAVAGAAAALTGLLFVGLSISLEKILSLSQLPTRALTSLVLLLVLLIVSVLMLVPNQCDLFIGIELIVIGILTWLIILNLDRKIYNEKPKEYKRKYTTSILVHQVTTLPYIAAGISILAFGERGMYWIAVSIIFSFIKAIIDAWVLLIEINR